MTFWRLGAIFPTIEGKAGSTTADLQEAFPFIQLPSGINRHHGCCCLILHQSIALICAINQGCPQLSAAIQTTLYVLAGS
jgi:hypothetical protein